MNKMRKGKKMLLVLLILIILIIVGVICVNVIKRIQNKPETPAVEETQQSIPLPETTYSDMEVKNIHMDLLKNNKSDGSDETVLSMEIHNTTDKKVENEKLTAVLFGADGNEITRMPTSIRELNPGGQYNLKVVLKGDVTATTYIKLIEN